MHLSARGTDSSLSCVHRWEYMLRLVRAHFEEGLIDRAYFHKWLLLMVNRALEDEVASGAANPLPSQLTRAALQTCVAAVMRLIYPYLAELTASYLLLAELMQTCCAHVAQVCRSAERLRHRAALADCAAHRTDVVARPGILCRPLSPTRCCTARMPC